MMAVSEQSRQVPEIDPEREGASWEGVSELWNPES